MCGGRQKNQLHGLGVHCRSNVEHMNIYERIYIRTRHVQTSVHHVHANTKRCKNIYHSEMVHGLTKLLVQGCMFRGTDLPAPLFRHIQCIQTLKLAHEILFKALHDKCLNLKVTESRWKGGNDIRHLEHGFHSGYSAVTNFKRVNDLKAYLYMCAITTLMSSLLASSPISVKCLNWDSLGESKQQSNVFIRH